MARKGGDAVEYNRHLESSSGMVDDECAMQNFEMVLSLLLSLAYISSIFSFLRPSSPSVGGCIFVAYGSRMGLDRTWHVKHDC